MAHIKAYSKKELCAIYGVSYTTLRKWLRPHMPLIKEPMGIRFTPHQVRQIFEILGSPGE